MQLFNRSLPKKCRIVLTSDWHIGSRHTHYDGIEECVRDIAKPSTYAIILGDLAEAMTVDDHRFDPNTNDLTTPTVMKQYERVADILRIIKDKVLYINDGNHDYRHAKVVNFLEDIVCRNLGIPYGTYSSKLTISDNQGKARLKFYTTHGYGSIGSSADDPIRQKSNLRLSLKRKMAKQAGDCHLMAMGHTHKLLTAHPEHNLYLTDDGTTIKQHYFDTLQTADPYIHPDHRYYANTGSFLKSQIIGCSGYAERFGYPPEPMGYIVVHINDWKIERIEKVRV